MNATNAEAAPDTRPLDSNGRINLEHALRTCLEVAAELAEKKGTPEDPVLLSLRAALATLIQQKFFAQVEHARELLEEALIQDRGEVAERCLAAELRVDALEREKKQQQQQFGGVTWIAPKRGAHG